MRLKASENLRGTVVLGSVNVRLTKGLEFTLTDEAVRNRDVQALLERGVIKILGASAKKQKAAFNRANVQNVYHRVLAVNCLKKSLSPGDVVVMTAEHLEDPQVVKSIELGFLKVLGLNEEPSSVQQPKAYTSAQQETQAPENDELPPPEVNKADAFREKGEATVSNRQGEQEVPDGMYVHKPHATVSLPPPRAVVPQPVPPAKTAAIPPAPERRISAQMSSRGRGSRRSGGGEKAGESGIATVVDVG